MICLRNALIFLVLAILLTSCAAPETSTANQPVTLKVVVLPLLSNAPLYIAQEEGYFARQKLDIQFIPMTRSSDAIPALAQGQLDVVAGTVSFGLLNAMVRGAKIKFVADKGYIATTGCDYNAIVARRDLVDRGELNSPEQLKGRQIIVQPASFSGYYVDKLLSTVGLGLNDIKTTDIPDAVMPDALEKGSVDAAAAIEPWITRMVKAGHTVIWMPAQRVVPDFQSGFIIYGPNLLEKDQAAAKRFMVAYLQAVRQYYQGKTERNLDILVKHLALEREILREACWPPFRHDALINVTSVLDFQAWGLRKGFLDGTLTEQQFWDPSIAEYADKVLDLEK